MRKRIVAISMLLVFFTIQYGKVATYLYCKWQAEVVQQLKECGCETHLLGIFSEKAPISNSPGTVQGIGFEYIQQISFAVPSAPAMISISSFTEYNSKLTERFITPAFRPPAV